MDYLILDNFQQNVSGFRQRVPEQDRIEGTDDRGDRGRWIGQQDQEKTGFAPGV